MDVAGLLEYRNVSAPIVAGMCYYFRLYAKNAAGLSPLCFPTAAPTAKDEPSDVSPQNCLTALPLEKPGPPTAVNVLTTHSNELHTAELETDARLEVEWLPPTNDGGLPILGFRIAQICDDQGLCLCLRRLSFVRRRCGLMRLSG